ncbi:MAG: hypothetical protein MJE66_12820 [Proteobacteria bacterium]|nr:hypothetical protein [Pseudomonadota bacterium]
MKWIRRMLQDRRGAAMVEYGLLVAGIALMTAAGTSVLGHKATDLIGTMAAVLPGAHGDDNNPIVSGRLIEWTDTVPGEDSTGTASTGIGLSVPDILAANGTSRLETNAGIPALGDLILEP